MLQYILVQYLRWVGVSVNRLIWLVAYRVPSKSHRNGGVEQRSIFSQKHLYGNGGTGLRTGIGTGPGTGTGKGYWRWRKVGWVGLEWARTGIGR